MSTSEERILQLLREPLPAPPEPPTFDEWFDAYVPDPPTVLPPPVPMIAHVMYAVRVVVVWLAIFVSSLWLIGLAQHHGWYTPCPYGHEADTSGCAAP